MKAAAAYIIQADEAGQKTLGSLMPQMLDVRKPEERRKITSKVTD
jgi:hypothetical protein